MTFQEWLQFVFLPRARELVDAGGPFPSRANVATLAVREFDGLKEFNGLIDLLDRFEAWMDSSRPASPLEAGCSRVSRRVRTRRV